MLVVSWSHCLNQSSEALGSESGVLLLAQQGSQGLENFFVDL